MTKNSSNTLQIAKIIARELKVADTQVVATINLLEEGSTVPFIARYRKEATGGLDDIQLRNLSERLNYLTELGDRRTTILKSIKEQDKLTPELEKQIHATETKVELEDLYAPFKPKRRTKAAIAREAGLEPLADKLLANPSLVPTTEALAFVSNDNGITDLNAALEGARNILIERIVETPSVVGPVREKVWSSGKLASKIVKGKEKEGAKFSDYFDFDEPIHEMPSHRALALLRGQKEGVLKINLDVPHQANRPHPVVGMVMREFGIANKGRPADSWMSDTAEQAWKSKLSTSSANDSISRLKEKADTEAIRIFSRNARDLLLAAPAGARVVMGIDPGIRTGCKIAVIDGTGKLLDTDTIYPHEPRKDWQGALATLAKLSKKHNVELVSVGNGTASRETDKLVAELSSKMPELKLTRVIVSEAGASIYSASELASKEFPNLDVSIRGAVSIARRLQDPLAELVKIDPKAIGVGQYQHDVDQNALARSLDAVVEDCVNAVGVDVNMASAPLLARVSGLTPALANNIVAFRDENGPFKARTALKKVPRMGPKAFEQAAGFLKIVNGSNPLDASAVHPEAYPLVKQIAEKTGRSVQSLIGDKAFLSKLNPKDFANETFGVPTVKDVLAELEKPGRDPRPEFKTATLQDGVEEISDLKTGMKLEGTVTNVTAFGAFVDVGVHQDGLVHISQLADTFVKDPHEIVKAGDVVKVIVTDVDIPRKRIALSMKSGNAENQRSRRA
ncbi:Tex family protein [Hirschia litorea]|uniref:Tex family protein n=1 Tax=Hirschia litorea TaxID=1199156 RepID=A0ABW2IHS8_9PROT